MLEVSCNEETPSAKNAPSNKGKKFSLLCFITSQKLKFSTIVRLFITTDLNQGKLFLFQDPNLFQRVFFPNFEKKPLVCLNAIDLSRN